MLEVMRITSLGNGDYKGYTVTLYLENNLFFRKNQEQYLNNSLLLYLQFFYFMFVPFMCSTTMSPEKNGLDVKVKRKEN